MDVLAPGVVRVDTDTDRTPIGACFGRNKPVGWWWRVTDRLGWSEEADLVPMDSWVQCRPPATPRSGSEAPDVAAVHEAMTAAGLNPTVAEARQVTAGLYTLGFLIVSEDDLDAAESSTTRTEPRRPDPDCSICKGLGVVGALVGDERIGRIVWCPNCGASSPVVDREPEAGRWNVELLGPEEKVLRWTAETGVQAGLTLEAADLDAACIQDGDEAVRAMDALVALVERDRSQSVSPVPQPDPDEHRTRVTQWIPHGTHRWVIVPNDWAVDTNVVVRRAGNKETTT